MAVGTALPRIARVDLAAGIERLWRIHAPLTLFALLTAVATLFFAFGIFLDDRVITGAPAWVKPLKFGISITLYSLTLTWILGFLERGRLWKRRLVNVLAWTTVVTFIIEWFAILTQVVRGTTSHFNAATTFDATVLATMAIAIMILWFANFVVAILLLMQKFESPVFGWSLRLAVLVTIVGMGLGFLMTSPTAQQKAEWRSGAPIAIVGAHSVGVPDGGNGLPLVGWSTEGGDLRVGHFVGMHALQVLPFLGWLILRRKRLGAGRQLGLVWLASGSYLALTLLLTWQALRAQPLLRPDWVTAAAFGLLFTATALAALLIARQEGPSLENGAGAHRTPATSSRQ